MDETPFLVLSEGYHGHGDEWVSLNPPSAIGVPPVHAFMRALPQDFTDAQIAEADAVILEPVMTDASDTRRRWLTRLRESCTKAGTVLIFDEVVTGFRWPRYTVASNWGITPDLIVVGKAIANGMPLAAVGGKYDVMNGDYFVSSTYAGETLSLVAAKATMTQLQTKADLTWLWKQGEAFQAEFNSLWPEKLRIDGYPSRGVLAGDPEVRALFMQEACKAGMLFGPSWLLSFPAAHLWKDAMVAIKGIVTRIKSGSVRLQGQMPTSPFAQRVREASQ